MDHPVSTADRTLTSGSSSLAARHLLPEKGTGPFPNGKDTSSKEERPFPNGKGTSGLKVLFGNDYSKWSYHPEQLSYVTPDYISQKMAELVKENYYPLFENAQDRDSIIIWDMFSGIGVDTIHLAKYFRIVTTEINSEIYHLLQKNIKTFGLESQILAYPIDCLVKWPDLNYPDLVYFDPPWGETFKTGEEFKFDTVQLSNGALITDLVQRVYREKTPNLVIKCPLRCQSFETIFQAMGVEINHIYLFKKHKLKFLFLKK